MDRTDWTEGPWKVLEVDGHVFVAGVPTPDHPYFGRTRTVEVLSDEDYPRKAADALLTSKALEMADLVRRVAESLDVPPRLRSDAERLLSELEGKG